MAKNLYQSTLAQQGPTTITIKTGPMKSKFSKPDAPKPDFCGLVINGEEFSYTIENAGIAAFITQHKGQTLTVVAEGSRDEATMTAVGAPASQMQQPAPRQAAPQQNAQRQPNRQPQPEHPPEPEQEQPARNEMDALRHFMARNRVMAVLALEAALLTKREFETAKQFEMPDDLLVAVYNSMLFGSNSAGFSGMNKGIATDLKFKPVQQQ